MHFHRILAIGRWLTLLIALSATVPAAELPHDAPRDWWPQFHGPRRDNRATETGLLRRWPEGGPKLVWQARGIGEGYASVAVAGGRIYTAGNLDDKTVITALDLSGRQLWQAVNGPAYDRSYPGARSTPTFSEGKLYHLNGDGHVACLDAATGRMIWQLSMLDRFQGRIPTWGLAESLLVDGSRVICCPGGPEVAVAALDKESGQTVWTTTGVGDKPAYASPIIVDYQGLRQIVTMTSASAIGVHAESGRLLWRHPREAPFDVNVSTLIFHQGELAFSCTWGRGTTKLALDVSGDRCSARQVWHTAEFDNEHGGMVLVDGHLYGLADGNHRNRHWACAAWETGEVTYTSKDLPVKASGTLTYADGMLYVLSDRGAVALVRAQPERFEIVSQFDLPKQGEGPLWAHPVVCGGRLYVRHAQYLYAYDVRDPGP